MRMLDPLGPDEAAFSEVTKKAINRSGSGSPESGKHPFRKTKPRTPCLPQVGRKLKRIGFETQGFEANLLFDSGSRILLLTANPKQQ